MIAGVLVSSFTIRSTAFVLFWCAAASAQLTSPAKDKYMIERVKQMSANALDSAQPAIRLEDWLQKTFEFAEPPDWQIGSCDLKPDYGAAVDIDLCVEVRGHADPGGFGARVHVLVGNFAQGAVGNPSVHSQSSIWRWCDNELENTSDDFYTEVDSLSRMQETIALARTKPCWADSAPFDASLQRYTRMIESLETHPNIRTWLETLTQQIRVIQRALQRTSGAHAAKVPKGVMPVTFEPDTRALLAIARKSGEKPDIAFFEQLDRPKTGCKNLVARERGWRAFQRQYPDRYVRETAAELETILTALQGCE